MLAVNEPEKGWGTKRKEVVCSIEVGCLGVCRWGVCGASLPGCEDKLGRHWCCEGGDCGVDEVT